jgi:hypothetical protein
MLLLSYPSGSKFITEMLTLDILSFTFEGTSSWQQSFERRTESMVDHCRQCSGSIFSNSLIKISEEPCACTCMEKPRSKKGRAFLKAMKQHDPLRHMAFKNAVQLAFSRSSILVIENLRGGEFSVNCSFPHPGCTY